MVGKNSDNSDSRLFISYSRRNMAQVYPLADALIKAGIEVWIDRQEIDPLDDFPAQIRDGLARSNALLAWYSPEYAQSSYCQKEITAAWVCTQRLTCDILSRILIVNPEEGVEHIALGDVGRQNYLAVPKNTASLAPFIQLIRDKLKLVGHSDDFAALHEFKKPVWHPYPQFGSSRFVGRLRELWCIHTALNPVGISDHENPNVLVQLTGLGGIGKSLLAIEYAKRFGAAYPGGIHWLRAYGFDPQKPMNSEAREGERQRQIENLAVLHEIPIRDKKFREIRRDLGKKLEAGERYLWIVDDLPPGLDQGHGFPDWCAPSGNGHTLITTRLKEYEGLGIPVNIDMLDPAAALKLLTKKREPQSDQEWQDAEELAEDLGRHALALDVAGHFLLDDKGFAALSAELASDRSDPLGEIIAGLEGQLPGGHEKSIVATLLQSVRLLKQEGLNLLRLACELQSGTPIPFRLADKIFARAFVFNEQSAENYRQRAMSQLKIHSLSTVSLGGVEGDEESDVFSVHTLVRYTLLHGDPKQEEAILLRQQLRDSALWALGDLLPGVIDIRCHASLELEVAHARYLALEEPRTANETALCKLLELLALFVGERGNYLEAIAIAEKALAIKEKEDVLGKDDPDTLNTRASIAYWIGETGRVSEALQLCQKLLIDRMRILGADHSDTLRTRYNIARWTGKTGKSGVRKALRLFQKLLSDQIQVLSKIHQDWLETRHEIAMTVQMGDTFEAQERLYEQEKTDIAEKRKALQLFRKLLSDQMLSEQHQDWLETRHEIAYLTAQMGDTSEAQERLFEQEKEQVKESWAIHRVWLMTRHEFAFLTDQMGDVSKALGMYYDLLPDQELLLGAEHHETLRTRSNIAYSTAQMGDTSKALRLFRELLPVYMGLFGAGHPETKAILGSVLFLERQEYGYPSAKQRSDVETYQHTGPKIGRNELCPCGSGLKYKRCHGNKG